MVKRIYFIVSCVFLMISHQGFSQCMEKPTGNKKIAKNYMTFGQFNCALEEYLIIYNEKPDKAHINRVIAECYAGIPGLEKKAIKFGEFLLERKKFTPQDLWILANAYHKNEQFKKSIYICNKYIEEFKPVEYELGGVQKLITNCENALELIKFPLKVKFENLGEKINSKWDELNPIPTANEGQLIFTTTRKTVMGGYSTGNAYLSDIFISKLKGKRYSNPRSIGTTFNSIDVDEYAGSSADNRYMFIATDGEGFQIFNLKMTYMKPRARSWPKPLNLIGINSNTTNEKSATINNEGNMIIFSSDRPGGIGGYDLWLSRKLPDGNWAVAVNLGPEINTVYDDVSPQFNKEQTGINFASQGHFNMGGFDIFKSTFSDDYKKWTTPRNLGYPVNGTNDDFAINFLQDKRLAYKSDYRDDSYGMADLYRLVFLDSTPQLSILNVKLKTDEITRLSIDSLAARRDMSIEILDSLQLLRVQLDSLQSDSLLGETEGIVQQTDEFNEDMADSNFVFLSDSMISVQIDSMVQLIAVQNEKIQQTNPNCYAEITISNSTTDKIYGRYKSNTFHGGILMILEPGEYGISVSAEGYYPLNKSLKVYDKTKFKEFINKSYTLRKRK